MIKLLCYTTLIISVNVFADKVLTNTLQKQVKIITSVSNTITQSQRKKTKQKQKFIPTKILVERLNTQDVSVIISTIRQIGKQDKGSKFVLKKFEVLLNHTNANVRQEILDAVSSFDVIKPMLTSLAKCLNDPVEDIRLDAADIIGDIETRKMITIFVNALTNKYEDVRENADFYLQFWTDEDFTNAVQWLQWWKENESTFVFD